MNYIDELAIRIAREAGDYPIDGSFAGIELYRQYALLLLAKGGAVTAEDVHNGWAVWACAHRLQSFYIKPFNELASDVQHLNEIYVELIRNILKTEGE